MGAGVLEYGCRRKCEIPSEEATKVTQMNLLKARMTERNMNMTDLAGAMGMHLSTLYRRFSQPEDLHLWEIQELREILGLNHTQLVAIFFAD